MRTLTDREALARLAADIGRIVEGDHDHRMTESDDPLLQAILESVRRLSERMESDRAELAHNIESLDLTNRALHAARDQVVRSARLASVGTLAAGIAHEVGNPLGAILGFVDVARARAQRAGSDTELLDSIREEAQRIDRIIRGLLDYARPSKSGARARTAADIVDRLHDLLDRQGKLDGVETEWDASGTSEEPLAEAERLEQVLVNVLLNALHAVGEADRPAIRVRAYEAEGAVRSLPARRGDDPPELNYLHRRREAVDEEEVASVHTSDLLTVFEVTDNGHGISDEVMEHLFDPFFTTKGPGEGTGLGLSICARLLEGMGASITAERPDEGGARFVIRVPMLYDVPDVTEHRNSTEMQ